FKLKIDTHAIYKEDLENFCDQYEELVAQAKVITRVSDRLQKKLDTANVQIREQNEEIKDKNQQLEVTIQQLAVARVGRKASTIMLTVALVLFVTEQWLLQPLIESYVSIPYLDLAILAALFFIVKFLESALEEYFMTQEKKKIIKKENLSSQLPSSLANAR
ncbi:MAG: hypothetical protein OEY56_12965, partial [Cyclobacteriaceae bacterium]|nr:hypothetical protein [Cyclobacteriaceae bacterium]